MRSINLISALAATATLGLAATAEADTFCVGSPSGCPAGAAAHSDVQSALDAAAANAGHDVVRIGSGTFTTSTGLNYYPAGSNENTVDVVGEGDATVLEADTASKSASWNVFTMHGGTKSRIERLRVVVPAADSGDTTGLAIGHVDVESVRVTGDGSTGISMSDGALRDVEVDMPGAFGVTPAGPSVSIHDSRIRAARGVILSGGGSIAIKRTDIRAVYTGFFLNGGTATIDSSLVQVTADNGIGIESQAPAAGISSLVKASHVTVVGAGGVGSKGVHADSPQAAIATLEIDNSIVRGFQSDVVRTDSNNSGEANVYGSHVNYAFWGTTGSGQIDIDNVIDADPGFADAAAGDFRLPRTSPMVDVGRADSYVQLGGKDLLGFERTRGANRDLGAYEYQDVAPVAVISGAGDREPGQALALGGGDSHDLDANDALTYEWAFGDGTTAEGKDVAHAWAAAGSYEVELTVTDQTGKSGTATATVNVVAPPATETPAPGGEPATGTVAAGGSGVVATAGDTLAPALSGLRLNRAKGRLRFRLGEAATVRVRVERRRARTFRAAAPAKRFSGKPGLNTVKVATRKLRRGNYRLVVTAVDAAGNRSVKRLAFRVV